MLEVKIKPLHPDAIFPIAMSSEAACFDVTATKIELSYNTAIVRLGFATEIPKGYKGVIVPRSSLSTKGWILGNHIGQIDSDYRGEWQMRFEAIPRWIGPDSILRYPSFPYTEGDRIGQVYFEKVLPVKFIATGELNKTERGGGGFGSTKN